MSCDNRNTCVGLCTKNELTVPAFSAVRSACPEAKSDVSANANNPSQTLPCTDRIGMRASSAPQRRRLHSERLRKLVRRMMAEREAERRAALA